MVEDSCKVLYIFLFLVARFILVCGIVCVYSWYRASRGDVIFENAATKA